MGDPNMTEALDLQDIYYRQIHDFSEKILVDIQLLTRHQMPQQQQHYGRITFVG